MTTHSGRMIIPKGWKASDSTTRPWAGRTRLRVPPQPIEPMKLRTSLPDTGEFVRVVGYPLGQKQFVANGYIATKVESDANYLTLDLHANDGHSGGPVLDSQNRVVGIVVSRLVNRGHATGISKAITVFQIQQFLDETDI